MVEAWRARCRWYSPGSHARGCPLAWNPLRAGRDEYVNGRSTERRSTAQRVAFLTAEDLSSFHSIAVHRRDGATLQALCVGSQWRRCISDRSVMASVRDRKRESLLRVLLMASVYEATHAAFDLGRSQW
jgi:hypothetical protein